MKTVLVVGAGRYQLAVIRRARELDLRVVAVDRNPDAPGLAEASIGRVVDFSDTKALIDNLSDLQIDGVLTVQAERAVPMVAEIAEALGLPGIGARTAHLMTNKPAMRDRLEEEGVPQPRFAMLSAVEEARGAVERIGLPAVLKPALASGQLGVFRVESPDQLDARAQAAIEISPKEGAILEEFVEGTEMNGIVVVEDGEVLSVILCDRLRPAGPSFGVSWIHLYPPDLSDDALERAKQVAGDAARALGLRTGIAFPQLIAARDGRISLVECAARIGGLMAELARHALGVDLLEVAIRIALGERVPAELVRERFRQPVAVRFLTASPGPLPAGRVTRVGSLENVLTATGVVDAALYAEEGEIIRPVMRISDRRGYVIAVGRTSDEALARAESAAQLVDIDVDTAAE
jgi:biotin carboxylase